MDFLKIQAPKGTRDLTSDDARAFSTLEQVSRRIFALHAFEEIRTPIFEAAELFSRSLGETSDVVEKEMFTFTDRGERMFALRPEGTAGVVRHYVENSLWVKSPVQRFYYTGPMFRAERPQAGRFRQFWQIGSEFLGTSDASADADTVLMAARILKEFGIAKFSIDVNSLGDAVCRPKHREALLKYLQSKEDELTEESQRRMKINPLRVLDSKVDGPKLTGAPVMKDYLCDACRAHHQQFLSLIESSGEEIRENPRLVRGLDYYNRTVFEFVSPDLGAQSALAAGGRYDGLVEMLGGPPVPAVGFALGMDRLVMARGATASSQNGMAPHLSAAVIPLSVEALPTAFELAQQLRLKNIAVPPVSASKKMKNQLSAASDAGATWAVIIGEDELKKKSAMVKNLQTRQQSEVPLVEVPAHLC